MSELNKLPLATVLSDLRISMMYVPFVASRETAANWIITNLSHEIENIYTVGWEDDPAREGVISFPHLLEKVSMNRNSLFIILDIVTFSSYVGEIETYAHLGNFFLIMGDALMDVTSLDVMYEAFPDMIRLWPAPLDMPIEIIYNKKTNMLAGRHLRQYQEAFTKWREREETSYLPDEKPDKIFGLLNVFLDEKVPSLESQPVDVAFRRAPKFKDLTTNILFHNKKRHYVNMVGGEHGITAFESLWNRLDIKNIPLHIIRSEEPQQTKEEKIDGINSTNTPLVVVSNFHFTNEMALKNIDYYHITSGGSKNDFFSVFFMLRGVNYTGSYPRKFHINNYVSETPFDDFPLDAIYEKRFQGRLEGASDLPNDSRIIDPRIVFDSSPSGEGDELVVVFPR